MHEPRQTQALRQLVQDARVAALGTIGENGAPEVSMVPFAVFAWPGAAGLLIHVSELAAHSRNLRRDPRVGLLLTAPLGAGDNALALPRVSLEGLAEDLAPADDLRDAARAAYLARFPQAEITLALPDFRFVVIRPGGARHVAGFGAARRVEAAELVDILSRMA